MTMPPLLRSPTPVKDAASKHGATRRDDRIRAAQIWAKVPCIGSKSKKLHRRGSPAKRFVLYFALAGAIAASSHLLALEQHQALAAGDHADRQAGLQDDARGARNFAEASWTAAREFAARALAGSIYFSRNRALSAEAKPIPPRVREVLKGHFPEPVLEEVRWTLPHQRIDLGAALARWYLEAGAVTLDHAIVFSGRKGAHDPALWAHELTHVVQYRRLGVGDFARLYTARWRMLEQPAERNEALIRDKVRKLAAAQSDRVSGVQMTQPGEG